MKKSTLLTILCYLLISCQAAKKSSTPSLATQPIEAIQLTGADTLIVTTGLAPFREKPDVNSIQLLEVVADSMLVTHEKIGNYYKVIIDKMVGYVSIAFAKSYSSIASAPSGVGSGNSTRSTLSSKGCPSVQCSGYTKKNTRCRNRTTNCSGRCYLH